MYRTKVINNIWDSQIKKFLGSGWLVYKNWRGPRYRHDHFFSYRRIGPFFLPVVLAQV